MSHLRELNQKPSFWDWVTDMGGAHPDQPWPESGNHPANEKNAGEGPSGAYPDEKKPLQDDEMEVNPPEYDGEDPPTPPELYPEDPFVPGHHSDEKLPDRSVPRDGGDEPGEDTPPHGGHGRHGGRGCRRGGGGAPWSHHHHGGPPHHHGPHPHPHPFWGGGRGGRGGFGGFGRRGRGFPFGGPSGFGAGGPSGADGFRGFPPGMPFGPFAFGGGHPQGRGWMEMAKKFAERFGIDPSQFQKANDGSGSGEEGVDFEPAIDVYSTPKTYVVHLALAGAKKEDVAVTWDESSAALTVSGVVTRGVDEEMAGQLAMGERPVGFFKRVVRLGDRDHPAHVDAESISAKMEEGVLKITVGKVENFVEVRKVQVD